MHAEDYIILNKCAAAACAPERPDGSIRSYHPRRSDDSWPNCIFCFTIVASSIVHKVKMIVF